MGQNELIKEKQNQAKYCDGLTHKIEVCHQNSKRNEIPVRTNASQIPRLETPQLNAGLGNSQGPNLVAVTHAGCLFVPRFSVGCHPNRPICQDFLLCFPRLDLLAVLLAQPLFAFTLSQKQGNCLGSRQSTSVHHLACCASSLSITEHSSYRSDIDLGTSVPLVRILITASIRKGTRIKRQKRTTDKGCGRSFSL